MPDAVNPKEVRAALDGKVPLDYLEPVALIAEAHVMKHGADKYGRRNYRDTPMKMSVYVGALLRHTLAWGMGEDIDPDSGQPHLAHIRACCAVMQGAIDAGTAVDDRLEASSTPLSDRVHVDGDHDAKGLTAEYNSTIQPEVIELSERLTPPPVKPFVIAARCCVPDEDVDRGCLLSNGDICADVCVQGTDDDAEFNCPRESDPVDISDGAPYRDPNCPVHS